MFEAFYEVIEALEQEKGGLLETFRILRIEAGDEFQAKAIAEQGAPLDSWIGFIDCAKIPIYRPKGRKALQRATY